MTTTEAELDKLRGEIQKLRSDLEQLGGTIGRAAKAGVREAGERACDATEDLRADWQKAAGRMTDKIEDNPVGAALAALGIGLLLGRLFPATAVRRGLLMNARLVRTTLAVASVLIASIVIGGMIVFVGGLAYRWIADAASPGIALTCLVSGSLIIGGVIVFLGQYALRQALRWSQADASLTPEQMIVGEIMKAVDANPAKLVMASLGVGFALGLSPRLRRVVYRTIIG